MFDTLTDRLSGILDKLRSKGRLSESDINATCREIRLALLEADVALGVVKQFIGQIKTRARGSEVSGALNPAQQVIKIVHEELVTILGGEARRLRFAKQPPTVIMLAGLQGSGKTTLAGKLARWLAGQGHQPLLVAADLQRPNAVQQLQVLGERAAVEVYAPQPGNGAGDPVRVAAASIEHAQRQHRDVVIIDTAGRLGVDAEMMAQAAAIRDVSAPDEVIFVVDAMIGQDAVSTAEAFRDGVGITGVVLSKLDGDARGGAALSVRQVTGSPILFASTGEALGDFDVFHPERMASRILGMGDVLTLIEQAERVFEDEQKERLAGKLVGQGQFTLDDFLEQLLAVKKMGPIQNVLAMMPGMNQMKGQLDELDDKHLDKVTAIIRSMTPTERANSKLLNGSRRVRIANGSGTTVTDVNQLVERFHDAQKQLKQMSGMFGGAGGGRKATKSPKIKRKGKGGKKGTVKQRRAKAPFGGMPGMPPGMPGMPGPGAEQEAEPAAGLPDSFDMPKVDFSKLDKRKKA